MPRLKSLSDLLQFEIADIRSAESQLVVALPQLANSAASPDLGNVFVNTLGETRRQLRRLDQVCERIGTLNIHKTCKAMRGLLEECRESLQEDAEPSVRDAALIAAFQRVQHYSIAAYGCSRAFAIMVGDLATADLLDESLTEERKTDRRLSEVAMSGINQHATVPAEAD